MYKYLISGGRVVSEKPIELSDPVFFKGSADIEIRYSDNLPDLQSARLEKKDLIESNQYQLKMIDGEFVVYREHVCVLYGKYTQKIIYCDFNLPYYNALMIVINRMMLDKYIFIHAGAFAKNQRSFALLANAGSGKSLTTWEIMRKGGHYITDDTLPLKYIDNQFWAGSSASIRPRFTLKSLQYYGVDSLALEKDTDRKDLGLEDKYYMPTKNMLKCTELLPLDTIFVLRPDDDAKDIEIKSIEEDGLRDDIIINNVLNRQFNISAAPQWRMKTIISDLYNIFRCVKFKEVWYKKNLDNLPHIVDLIWKEAI